MIITVISVRIDKSLIHFVVLMEHFLLFLTQLKTAHNPIVTAQRRKKTAARGCPSKDTNSKDRYRERQGQKNQWRDRKEMVR